MSFAKLSQNPNGGRPAKYFDLNYDQMMLVGMRESKAVLEILASINSKMNWICLIQIFCTNKSEAYKTFVSLAHKVIVNTQDFSEYKIKDELDLEQNQDLILSNEGR
ncbi:hypothetical protein [Vibrio crassostreae]|uniref:hypothetical protein n=1 Tax=Vibrio crassostreae TaxID=246167 RepID=UPI001B30EE49|nr:hypothetical protein [Vibrio crassostreae]